MKGILDDSLFGVFLRKNCEEILEEYQVKTDLDSIPIEERLENWFILGYTCVLCKYNSVRTWLGLLKNVNLGDNKELETVRSIAVHFLGSHQDRLHLNFSRPLVSGAEYSIAEGFYLAVKSRRFVMAVLFLHLAGWNYAVLGMKDVAAGLFTLGMRLSRSKQIHPVCSELCQSGLSALNEAGVDPKWGTWTCYFYRELCVSLARFPLTRKRHKGFEEEDKIDYERIFGRLSHESFLDVLEYDASILDRTSSLDDRSPNELLYAKLLAGRDISPQELNVDSFFAAGPVIDEYYATKTLQDRFRQRIIQVFTEYLEQDGFQLCLEVTPNLLRDAVSSCFRSFRERKLNSDGEMERLVLKMGCGSLYSLVSQYFNEPLRQTGVLFDRVMEFSPRWVRESYLKCLSNLDHLLAGASSSISLEWRVNLLAHLLQRTGDEKYVASMADCFRQSPELNHLKADISQVFEPYDTRLGVPDFHALLSYVSLRSVGVERYIDDPRYGRNLETFLSAFDGNDDSDKLGLYQFERLALHFDLLESEGWKGRTNLLDGREIYQLDSEDRSIVFFFLAQEGEWKETDSCLRFEQVTTPGISIPSPIQALNDYVGSELDSSERRILKVLVPFSNVFFYQPDVFLLGLKDVHVVPLKQLLELIGASMTSGAPSFFQLLLTSIPDPDLLKSPMSGGRVIVNWDFRHLINFCYQHPFFRNDLRTDVREIADEYEQVLSFGPIALLSQFIRNFGTVFSHPAGQVVFTYCCSLPDQPYSLTTEISMTGTGIRVVDFRLDEHSHRLAHSVELICRLAGTLLEVVYPFARFYHKLQIIGPSDFLDGVFDSEEEDERILSHSHGQSIKTVGRVFRASVHRFQKVFQSWKGDQEELVASIQVRRFAEDAARTAIMARNMSHNLGSHVMAYLKQHLASVSEMLRSNVFDQLFKNEKEFELLLSDPVGWRDSMDIYSVESVTLPFLVGLGRFISYLQERQDFIASVATDYIPPCLSLNFKDFIYDELNPDKRFKRHSDRKGEKPDNILLGNIARSEGLMRETRPTADAVCSEHDIILSFRHFDGEPVERVPGNVSWDPSKYYGITLMDARDALDSMRDYSLSIPGGITGRHAFFSIVENIIRNASKHGNWQDKDALKITFDIFSSNDFAERASGEDNLPGELSLRDVLRRYYVGAIDGQSLYFITVTDNLDTPYSSLSKLRRALIEDYVSASGRMVDTSKGIKEMRICSSWLRGFRRKSEEFSPVKPGERDSAWLNENDAWDFPAPVLYVRLSRNPGYNGPSESGHLQFIFAVRIPVRVLIVSPCFAEREYAELVHSFLDKHDWVGVTPKDFLENWTGRNYDFLLLDGKDETLYRMIRARSSTRVFFTQDISAFSFERLKKKDPVHLEDVWSLLWEKVSDYKPGERITIDDDRAARSYYAGGQSPEGLDAYLEVGEGIVPGCYVYKKHYESEPEFCSFQEYCEQEDYKPLYIEGVSGGNSTDRIVRCEPIDKIWFFRQLHVMKERIAIFDERLSNMTFGMDSDRFKSLSRQEDRVVCRTHKGMLFAHKGVYIFNFVKEGDSSFSLYGLYRGADEICMLDPRNPACYCQRIATFSKDAQLRFTDPYYERLKFDRISIHQGLLDKIYDVFGIKDNKDKKEELTSSFYKALMACDDSFNIEGTRRFFLPGMTIHSGRSKPSEEDMPQMIPFIQYASLEHAVQDCKYTLVELLDSASYE